MHLASKRSNCVLIVEDSVDLQMLIGEFLESEGFSVSYATNGQEALNTLKSSMSLPCMILLDIMMPVMDGLQFREHQIKDAAISKIPVVVMTADANIKNKLNSLHIKEYFSKPLNMDALLTKVQHYC